MATKPSPQAMLCSIKLMWTCNVDLQYQFRAIVLHIFTGNFKAIKVLKFNQSTPFVRSFAVQYNSLITPPKTCVAAFVFDFALGFFIYIHTYCNICIYAIIDNSHSSDSLDFWVNVPMCVNPYLWCSRVENTYQIGRRSPHYNILIHAFIGQPASSTRESVSSTE